MHDEVGFVYVIKNPAMPGLAKIGVTQTSPGKRAKELVSTGVPHQFRVDYFCVVYNPYDVESAVHEALAAKRTRGEWFDVSSSTAIQAIRSTNFNLLDEVWNEAFLAENKIILANETEQVPPSRRAKFLGRSGIEAKKILSSDLMRDLVENAARTVGKRFADAVLELLRKKK